MRKGILKIWEHLRSAQSALKKGRRRARLGVEVLEDRCVPTANFIQTNLASDISGLAQITDAHLINPWGLAYDPSGGPFWISENNAGTSTVFNSQGQIQTPIVTIPLPAGGSGNATPTGVVFNSDTTAFMVTSGANSGASQFIFATEDGTISGWNSTVDATHAILKVDNSANPSAGNGAVYKGLAIGTDSTNRLLLYAANFRTGKIDVFDKNFQATTVSGGFHDANIPAGYAPFNIQNLNGKLYVTYARQDATKANDIPFATAGFVDVFTTNGQLVSRLVSGGQLDAPWGLAIAPASFGSFGGDLLVGNFGDGHINAYSPTTGSFVGQVKDAGGNVLTIPGLWGLKFGNGGQAGDSQTLFFSAGLNHENDGLFGSLKPSAAGTVSGLAYVNATSAPLIGATITLDGTPSTAPIIPVHLTAVTTSTGAFNFTGLPPGTYHITAGPFTNITGTVTIGSIHSSTGVKIVAPVTVGTQSNVVIHGGVAANTVGLAAFFNTSTTGGLPSATPGTGNGDAKPIVTSLIGAQALSSTTTQKTIDLAGRFIDPNMSNSSVTMNITVNGVTKKINLTLFDTTAPQTVANFYDYINSGAYNNSFFHRLTSIATDGIGVLQGGGAIITNGTGPSVITAGPTIPDEISASNLKGTLAMANTGSANTASDQFFFNTTNNTTLNSKFTVFAKVADAASQAVLDSLAATPVNNLGSSSATITATGASEAGNTVTITTSAAHNFTVGQQVTVAGVGVAGYNGTFTIASVPSSTTFTYSDPTSGLAASGSGTATAGPTFAQHSPSLLLNEMPLTGGTATDFPTDASRYLVINNITVTKRDDFLTYSLVANTNPSLVVATLSNEQLTIAKGSGSGSATIVVRATDRFGQSVTQTFTVSVTPGPADPAHTTVAVSPTSIQSNGTSTVTLTAKDATGVQETTGGATVVFGLGGGAARGTFGAVTDHGNGIYTAVFTGTTAGTNTITATIGGLAVTTTAPTITVTPGPVNLAHTIVHAAPISIVTGNTSTITLVANDINNNQEPTGGSTIVFTLGSGTAQGNFSPVTDNGNGIYTATFTGTVAGTNTITATIDGHAVTSTAPTITVVGPLDLAQSSVSVNPASIQSGSATIVTLTAKDVNGNQEPTGGATVAFSLVGGTAQGTFGPVTDNSNGTYSTTFTGTIAGTNTITATINTNPITSTAPTITVTPGPFSLGQSTVVPSPSTFSIDGTTTVTLTAKDANGNQEATGGLSVAFSLGVGTANGNFSNVVDHGDGTYSATFAGTTVGTNTINATINGNAVATAPAIIINPGPADPTQSTIVLNPTRIQNGDTTTVTLTARDVHGNPEITGGSTVVFSLISGVGGQGTFSPTQDNGDGTYTSTFTGTIAGANTVTATLDGNPVTTTAPPVVIVGPVDLTQSSVELNPGTILDGDSALVTFVAKDANGSQETQGGLTVAFQVGGGAAGTAQGNFSAVTDHGDGTYTAVFTATIPGSNTITATIGASPVTSTAPTVTVQVDPAQSNIQLSPTTISLSGINSTTVTLTAKDANGVQVPVGGSTVAFSLDAGGTAQGNFSTVTDNLDGTYTATFTGTGIGASTVDGTIDGQPLTSILPTITVTA